MFGFRVQDLGLGLTTEEHFGRDASRVDRKPVPKCFLCTGSRFPLLLKLTEVPRLL